MNHSNSYVLIYTKPEDRNFLSYYYDLKYDAALKNSDTYIKNVVVKHFDIIHHECRGDKLEKPYDYYQTVKDKELKNYEDTSKKKLLDSCFRNQKKTKQNIFLRKTLLNVTFLVINYE